MKRNEDGSIDHPVRLKCTNLCCNHVFVINDREEPIINDPGYVIFKCPECGSLVKVQVNNVDYFNHHPDFQGYFEDSEDIGYKKYVNVPLGAKIEDNQVVSEAWNPDKSLFWVKNEKPLGLIKPSQIQCLHQILYNCKQADLANQIYMFDVQRIFIKIYDRSNSKNYAVYSKGITKPEDYCAKGLKMIHHSSFDFRRQVAGVYSRDFCIQSLNACLARWESMCDRIIIASPFIGFEFNNKRSITQVLNYWEWLNESVDINRTLFITRKKTFSLLKKRMESSSESMEYKKRWGKLNDLLTAVAEAITIDEGLKNCNKELKKKKNTNNIELQKQLADLEKRSSDRRVILYEGFHAKFYAGIFTNHVEVLVGSYNIHEGKVLENLLLLNMTIEEFTQRYLNELLNNVKLSINPPDRYDPKALCLEIKGSNVKSNFTTVKQFEESLQLSRK